MFDYFKDLFRRITWLLATSLSSHVLVIDRYIMLFLNEKFFASYVLIANILSSIPTIMDTLYMAKNRSRYPKEIIKFREIFTDRDFLISTLLGTVGASIILFSFLFTQNAEHERYFYGGILMLSYFFYTIAIPFLELAFWHKSRFMRISIEAVFIILCIAVGGIIHLLGYPVSLFMLSLFCLHALRSIFLIFTMKE